MIDLHPERTIRNSFLAWIESHDETEEDAREVVAFDAEEAATDLAESDDSEGDYAIVMRSSATICVKQRGGDEVSRFVVSGETVPMYTARRIEGTKP